MEEYLKSLKSSKFDQKAIGKCLLNVLIKEGKIKEHCNNNDLQQALKKIQDTDELLDLIVKTKGLQSIEKKYAETQSNYDGGNFNQQEFEILSRINTFIEGNEAYDNGAKEPGAPYDKPMPIDLFITNGMVLKGVANTVDFQEISKCKAEKEKTYFIKNNLVERLLPGFLYANNKAIKSGQKTVITIPGIGCGEFAGEYKKFAYKALQAAIAEILEKNPNLENGIESVIFDTWVKTPKITKHQNINDVNFFTLASQDSKTKNYGINSPTEKLYELIKESFEDAIEVPKNCSRTGFVAGDQYQTPLCADFKLQNARAVTNEGWVGSSNNGAILALGINPEYIEYSEEKKCIRVIKTIRGEGQKTYYESLVELMNDKELKYAITAPKDKVVTVLELMEKLTKEADVIQQFNKAAKVNVNQKLSFEHNYGGLQEEFYLISMHDIKGIKAFTGKDFPKLNNKEHSPVLAATLIGQNIPVETFLEDGEKKKNIWGVAMYPDDIAVQYAELIAWQSGSEVPSHKLKNNFLHTDDFGNNTLHRSKYPKFMREARLAGTIKEVSKSYIGDMVGGKHPYKYHGKKLEDFLPEQIEELKKEEGKLTNIASHLMRQYYFHKDSKNKLWTRDKGDKGLMDLNEVYVQRAEEKNPVGAILLSIAALANNGWKLTELNEIKKIIEDNQSLKLVIYDRSNPEKQFTEYSNKEALNLINSNNLVNELKFKGIREFAKKALKLATNGIDAGKDKEHKDSIICRIGVGQNGARWLQISVDKEKYEISYLESKDSVQIKKVSNGNAVDHDLLDSLGHLKIEIIARSINSVSKELAPAQILKQQATEPKNQTQEIKEESKNIEPKKEEPEAKPKEFKEKKLKLNVESIQKQLSAIANLGSDHDVAHKKLGEACEFSFSERDFVAPMPNSYLDIENGKISYSKEDGFVRVKIEEEIGPKEVESFMNLLAKNADNSMGCVAKFLQCFSQTPGTRLQFATANKMNESEIEIALN